MSDDQSDAPQPVSAYKSINFELLAQLATKSHPLLNIADDFEGQIREIPIAWTREVFQQARSAHHLLDMVGIPAVQGYASDLDARVYLAIRQIQELEARLARIASWHRRLTSSGGITHDACAECGWQWPCPTWRRAVLPSTTAARLDEHDPTDRCALIHCYAHDVDEPGHGYITCPECGHLYRTAGELRRAYLRQLFRLLRREWSMQPPPPVTDPLFAMPTTRWQMRRDALIATVRGLFRRADDITFCQHCIHDF